MAFDYTPLLRNSLPPGAPGRREGFPPYNFVGGHNDREMFPVDAFIEASRAVISREGQNLAMYGLGDGPHTEKRAVIGRPVLRDAGDGKHSRSRLLGDLHEGVHSSALVLHVEAWLPSLDQLHLMDEREELVRDVVPFDAGRFANELPGLLAPGGPEVRKEAGPKPHGLSDVEGLVTRTVHPVDTRAVLGPGADVSTEVGCRGHA